VFDVGVRTESLNMTELGIAAIDHVMTFVPCLDAASDQFERMGFRLSPVSRIETMGISNRMILMQPRGPNRANFIELMSPHDPDRLPVPMRAMLSGEPGARSIVLAASDINMVFDTISEIGFSPSPPVHVRREWKIAGEPSVYPEFEVILPIECPLTFNACQYHNAELYSRPDWLNHPNTAIRITTIFAVSNDRAKTAFFEDLLGRTRKYLTSDEIRYPSSEIDLLVMAGNIAEERFGVTVNTSVPKYVGYEVNVASLEQLRRSLDIGHVPWTLRDEAVLIAPEDGLGNIIIFRELS
jgi:hypothetical protein